MRDKLNQTRRKALSFAAGSRGRSVFFFDKEGQPVKTYDVPTQPLDNTKRMQNYQQQNQLTCGSSRLTQCQVRSLERGRRRTA